MNAGTRAHDAQTFMSGSRILPVSATIFHSSLVMPLSRNTSMCGMTLNAIGLGYTSGGTAAFSYTAFVWR